MDTYLDLRDAIVRQAVDDYADAFMGNAVDSKNAHRTLWDCRKFFHSKWFDSLTCGAIDGDSVMQNAQIQALERAINAYKAVLNTKNTVSFRATVQFPRQFGDNTRQSLKYVFPQALADDIMELMKAQLHEMQKVLSVLKQQAASDSEPDEAEQQNVGVDK